MIPTKKLFGLGHKLPFKMIVSLWKLTYPLKKLSCKTKFPYNMVPFQVTCWFSGLYHLKLRFELLPAWHFLKSFEIDDGKMLFSQVPGMDVPISKGMLENAKVGFTWPKKHVVRNWIWVFPKIGVPQNGWFIRENLIRMDDLGVPLFLETPILDPCCWFDASWLISCLKLTAHPWKLILGRCIFLLKFRPFKRDERHITYNSPALL